MEIHSSAALRIDRAAHSARRARLARSLRCPALIFAGVPQPRNYAANTFAFRATSHFLYLVGKPIEGGVLWLEPDGRATVLRPRPPEDDALWHGPSLSAEALGERLGCEVRDLEDLASLVDPRTCCTLPAIDAVTRATQSALLGRSIVPRELEGDDAVLADAMIAMRLVHDEDARRELRLAAHATAEAHLAGMKATRPGLREWHVRAAMVGALGRENAGVSYEPIVTVHGEVLHNHHYEHVLAPHDLLLADVGAETAGGWAGDVTRTWPVSGRFSPTQRALYEVVLEAQRRAIEHVRPGVRYRDVHLAASLAIAEGLLSVGILRGASAPSLVEEGAHALFFPHGIGHLLGLDVHDMEDLGDRAGYAPGRARSTQFGLSYLRLDRDLVPGMAVTIEPGYYRVPAILASERLRPLVERFVDRDALARFDDVRGIRIEDDVLVTAEGAEVLTERIPKRLDEVEAALHAG
ncbi:MAG: aminopeptidase P family protein [Sandaracinaceae bacterium]